MQKILHIYYTYSTVITTLYINNYINPARIKIILAEFYLYILLSYNSTNINCKEMILPPFDSTCQDKLNDKNHCNLITKSSSEIKND
jgi:hypothetical protein